MWFTAVLRWNFLLFTDLWFSQNLASIHNMSFSQNTSKSCSQIQVKIVHKYKWKFARKHLHSLTIETEIGPWSRLLLLQLARNVASLFQNLFIPWNYSDLILSFVVPSYISLRRRKWFGFMLNRWYIER